MESIICPLHHRNDAGDDYEGCGHTFQAEPDEDGYVACPECGLTFEYAPELDQLQDLVNSGMAWKLEGHVGRTAMAAIENRVIALGEEAHLDYYGNYVPSRHEVKDGTPGAKEYARF